MRVKNTIFVQIASYRDHQLIPTLNDLIAQAKSPSNLYISIAWQHGPEDTLESFEKEGFSIETNKKAEDLSTGDKFTIHLLTKEKAHIELIDIPYLETKGACWARHLIQTRYANQKYTLQLDSHHRFVKDWDKVAIDSLESLRYKSKKPLLTAYIPSFDPEDDPAKRIQEPWKMDFDRFIPEGAVFFRPSTIDDWRDRKEPMLARFYSAHFAFADGSFATEVMHDPNYFFHGEEISIGVRAFTHGYDLYHPHKVIAWHEYTRKGRIKVWDDMTTQQKVRGKVELDWVQRNDLCHKRNRILFGMDGEDPSQIDFGKYGFGTERSVKDFEEYAGMSFKFRSVQQCVLDRTEPTLDWKKYTSEEEWEATLTRSNDVRILISKDELKDDEGNIPNDYDFWYVGIHDKDYNEISRKDLVQPQIDEYLKNQFVDYRFIFMGDITKVPHTFTVWPHSASQGWMKRLVKSAV